MSKWFVKLSTTRFNILNTTSYDACVTKRVKLTIQLHTSDASQISLHSKYQLRNWLVGTAYRYCGLVFISPHMIRNDIVWHSYIFFMAWICALFYIYIAPELSSETFQCTLEISVSIGNFFSLTYLSSLITGMASRNAFDIPEYSLSVEDKAHSI